MKKTKQQLDLIDEIEPYEDDYGRDQIKVAPSAICPSCAIKVKLGPKSRAGQQISCPDCDADLVIIRVNPPALDWAFEDEDDSPPEYNRRSSHRIKKY